MSKLLVNEVTGEQLVYEIGPGGSYFDLSRVVWDERIDGAMPDMEVGKIIREGDDLKQLDDYLPEHQAALDKKQQDILARQIDPTKMTVKQLTQILIDRGII